jgi:glycosyltransferase involved in cell wall biosynthesis
LDIEPDRKNKGLIKQLALLNPQLIHAHFGPDEASAMGLPVVSFASGGIPEAVKHEETGLLAKEKDWQGLADYIERLFNDNDLGSMNGQSVQGRC